MYVCMYANKEGNHNKMKHTDISCCMYVVVLLFSCSRFVFVFLFIIFSNNFYLISFVLFLFN